MSPETVPVGVALVGTGAFAREHAAALHRMPRLAVRYVVGNDLAAAAALTARLPGAHPVTDLQLALSSPEVRGVDVCSATPDHSSQALAAIRAGKHVLVEKPVALSLTELDDILTAAREAGTTLLVGQTVRFQPAVAALQREVAAGRIGALKLLHVSWYTGYVWRQGWRAWQIDPHLSGGHPVHNGTHAFDLATWLMTGRRPVRVFTRGVRTFAPDLPVPDSFHATVRFDDGSLVLVELAYALRQHGDSLRRLLAVGAAGTLQHEDDGDSGLHSSAARPPSPAVVGALDVEIAHWADVLEGVAAPLTTPTEIRAALATALAAQRSLEVGEPVDIEGEQT